MTNNNITNSDFNTRKNFSATFYAYKNFANSRNGIFLELINIMDEEGNLVQRHAFFELSEPDQFKSIAGIPIIGQTIYFSARMVPNQDLEDEFIFLDIEFEVSRILQSREEMINGK